MADAEASKAFEGNLVWVQLPPPAKIFVQTIFCLCKNSVNEYAAFEITTEGE